MFAKTPKKKLLLQAALLTAPMLLVGCSSVPDAANPVEWYRSTVEYFGDDEAEVEKTTPSKMSTTATAAASAPGPKKKIASGFKAAESSQRQYAPSIMRQGDVVNPLGEAQKVAVNEPPAPMAAPSRPVIQTQMANAAPKLKLNTQQRAAVTQPTPTMDNLSVGEVYAANVSQTRPMNVGATMNGSQMDTMGNFSFDTIVVSSDGVVRQQQNYKPQTQVASSSNARRDTYSSAMMIEPSVVTQGQAQSLSRFNSTMFSGSFQVATIQFGNGSANLTKEDLRILKEVITIHQQQGGIVRIVGHASSRTRDMAPDAHDKINQKVSLGRADKVARELLRLGMTGERLFVGGVADHQPLYQEVMPSGEAGNRRTEIFVDY